MLFLAWWFHWFSAPKMKSVLSPGFYGQKRWRQQTFIVECSFSMARIVLPKEKCVSNGVIEKLKNKRSAWTTSWQSAYLERHILKHYQAKGETVTCECYCALLTDELKPAIHTKQRRQLYAFFWVIPWHQNFVCWCFGTHCLVHLHRQVGMKYDWIWVKLEYLYKKRFGSKIAWVNSKEGGRLGVVQSLETGCGVCEGEGRMLGGGDKNIVS